MVGREEGRKRDRFQCLPLIIVLTGTLGGGGDTNKGDNKIDACIEHMQSVLHDLISKLSYKYL